MKIKLFNLFRKKSQFQDDFPIAQFSALPKRGSFYPMFLSLDKHKIYAHSARFMIKTEEQSIIENLIELHFHEKININEKEKKVADHDKILICYKFKEFGQDIVRVITNDNEFVKCLCEAGFEPPGPEIVFPDKNFGNYGSLQGEMAFWWDVYWEPFWKCLREDERKDHLRRSNFSVDTIEFLECRY